MKNNTTKTIWTVTLSLCIILVMFCISVVLAIDNRQRKNPGSITTYSDDAVVYNPVIHDPDAERVDSSPAWTSQDYDSSQSAIPNKIVLGEEDELIAVWIPYMSVVNLTPEKIDTLVATCKNNGANAIMFHVRPFGDALYESLFFPYSHLLNGTQGIANADGFDPLAYIIDEAHENGIQLHAWVNPLRIQLAGGRVPSTLSADNPYNVWRHDADPSNDDWVIDYDGGKFYNPAVPEVRSLIVNGMAELAANYNVDGVHWDDYFYPANDEAFDDSARYQSYLSTGGKMTLREWRTDNINTLIRDVYSKVKATNSNCIFGISPAGNIENCLAMGADVYEWCSSDGYIDYICPQIYWPFDSTVAPFAGRTDEWKAMITNPDIKYYVGLALYKAGSDQDGGKWLSSDRIISDQVEYLRSDKVQADGFMLYSYDYLTGEQTAAEMDNLRKLLLDG